jgi:hypothetical protein
MFTFKEINLVALIGSYGHFSVFPNVPQQPGLSCAGEDRK